MKSLPFSELVRKQTSVCALVAEADVMLERRDAEDVVLMRDGRYRTMKDAPRIAARSLGLVAKANRALAEEVFAEELPWLTWPGRPGSTDHGARYVDPGVPPLLSNRTDG